MLVLLAAIAHAQAPTPEYRVFSVKDGLPSVETYDVMQDSKGYLWIASDAGVSRFDGYTFRNYTSIDGLSDNTVFGISEDYKGRIWFRTLSGRIAYFYNDSIYSLPCNDDIQRLAATGTITSVHTDRGDTLWIGIGGSNHSLLKVFPNYNKVVSVSDPIKLCYYVSLIDDKMICGYPYGGKLLAYDAHRINIMSRTTFIDSIYFKFEKSIRLGPNMRAIPLSAGGFAFILCDAIFKVDKNGKYQARYTGKKINSIYEDRNRNLWLGAAREGVDMYPAGDITRPPVNYFPGKFITDIIQDHEGSYWLTTHDEGLLFAADLNFIAWKFGEAPSLKVSSLAVDKQHLWISFNDSSLIALDKRTWAVKKLSATGIILSIVSLDNGEVIAGSNSGMFIFSGNSRRLLPSLNTRVITKMAGKDIIWTGVYHTARQLKDQQVVKEITLQSKLETLHCDSAGTLWIGTVEGVWKLKHEESQPEYFGDKYKLLQNRVTDIKTLGNQVWFVSKGIGVIIMTPDTVINLTTADGLGSNICRSVCFDITGAAWVATNKGLSRIKLNADHSWTITNINSSNGLVSDDVRQVISDSCFVYAGTGHGITFFDVTRLKKNTSSPPVYLTAIKVNGKRRNAGNIASLQHDQNYISFYFTGITYKLPGKVKYIFQLEGIDPEPRIAYGTSVHYTTLPPGTYTFKVYAENNDGVRSAQPVSVSFTINKPFWTTWWFIGLSIMLVLGIITLIILIRERSIKRREAEKTKLTRKMSDLELRAIRAQMNPHFIFNALNSIQRYVLDSDPLSAQKYLAKFARLIRNVLSSSTHQAVPLSKELETLKLYVEIESLRFSDHFRYVFEVDKGLDADNLLIPSMFIQPYIENAIWHGLMHKEDDRKLSIQVKIEEEHLLFIIEDNGIGRARSQQMKKLGKKDHESFGMKLNQERIAVLNQVQEGETRLMITDLYANDQTPSGTRVEIQFPLVYAH